MNIILVPKCGGRSRPIRVNAGILTVFALMGLTVLIGIAYAGYQLGQEGVRLNGPSNLVKAWQDEMAKQRQVVAEAKQGASENLDALAMRLGRLQSHIIRLDALGGRLTEMAQLDSGEFDFTQQPAQGGPEDEVHKESVGIPNFIAALESLSEQVEDRAQQLSLLETMLMNRGLENQVLPAGRPITSGWLSSYFGMRTDPFTGRQERHKGVDFAGKAGSDVVAVAAGVVTWAGRRYGYGQLVEINHGNGYTTRYGHNDGIKVEIGEAVKKGQALALMGSTGRSTGPHVHFEVLRDGKPVDPMQYIRSKRGN